MTDYKAIRHYPVDATRELHDTRSRLTDGVILGVSMIGLAAWGGYELGWERRGDLVQQQAAPVVQPCPASNPDQDVLEHTWSHRGQVIHRECLIVSKPIYAQPRYRALSPTEL